MKKFLWILSCAVLTACLLFILPTEAYAAEIVDSGTCGENLTWTLDDAGVLTISGTGAMTDFAMRRPIPDVIPPWYKNCTAIQQIIIESGATSIGSQAFEGCTNLYAVSIPDTVQTIGVYAFAGCSDLRSICIPEGVVSIDTGAFLRCEMFLWIELPQSLQSIGVSAFKNPGSNYLTRHIVYGGTKSQWDQIEIGYDNTILTSDIGATRHYNSSVHLIKKETCSFIWWKCSSCGGIVAEKKETLNHEFKDGICAACGVDENWQYGLTYKGKIKINGYSGDKPYLIVPSHIEGYPVESLSFDYYPNDDTLIAIFIPSNVKEIRMPDEIWAGGIVKRFPNLKHILTNNYVWDDAVVTLPSSVIRKHFGSSSNKVSYTETCETVLFDCTDCGCFLTQKKATNGHIFTEGICTKCGIEDGWEYSVTTHRTVQITGYTGSKTEVIVPVQIEGMPVTEIVNSAFEDNVNLEAITIAPGVTRIGKSAFAGCSGLKHVTIPSSLIIAQESAFSGCVALEDVHIEDLSAWCNIDFDNFASNPLFYADKLYVAGQQMTKLVIPEDVDTIAAYTFCGYASMTTVNISSSVTNIETRAFSSCIGLTTITIPDSVTSIGDGAFEGCSGLTTITLGSNVQTVEKDAFAKCVKLETVNLQSIEVWLQIKFENYLADPMQVGSETKKLQIKGEPVTDLVIPEGVRTIRARAFQNCTKIQSIRLPKTLESISNLAFSGCAGMKNVYWDNGIITVENDAFGDCSSLECVYIEDLSAWCASEFKSLYGTPPLQQAWKLYLNGKLVTNLVIPEGVTTVGSRCFQACNSLESLTLPDSLRSVDSSAFSNCKNLKMIDFGSSVKILASSAFSGCSALENIVLPDSLQTLYSYAFAACSGLQSMELSSGLTTLGEKVFYGCESLREITIPGGVSSIGDSAFEDCSALRNVVIESGVEYIKPSAFGGCENVKTVVIPDTVKYIGNWAFYPSLRMEHIFYLGTQNQWNNINIESLGNGPLSVGQMHYVTETDCDHSYYRCQDCDETYNFYGTVIPEHTITFSNWDGSIIAQYFYHDGDKVSSPMVPEKETDNTYTYTFTGWDKPVVNCTGDASYTATYDPTYINYTVVFKDWDGTVLSTKIYHWGDKVTAPEAPTRQHISPNACKWTFAGWDKDVVDCAGEATYTATYTSSFIDYTVAFKNWDGTIISTNTYWWGDEVTVPNGPSKAADNTYTYTFAGWDNDVVACAGNATYTATFTPIYIDYTVAFKDWDGTAISSKTYHYGDIVDVPADPTKEKDDYYKYSFVGWDKDIVNCEGNAEYTAVFQANHYHTYTKKLTNPTCTEQGYTTYTCACGDSYKDTYVDALGHQMGQWKTTKEVTCTEEGSKRRECSRCDYNETDVIAATGHGYIATVTPPICTEGGYTTHTCACGDSYKDTYVDALGHQMGQWETAKKATCTKEGSKRRECSRCDYNETDVIAATGHGYIATVTPPICTEGGYTTHTCACGDSYKDTYVDALGHQMGQWETTKKATCTKEGSKRRECSRCNYTETHVITALGHSYGKKVTKPTYTKQGYTTYTCTCGNTYKADYVKATGLLTPSVKIANDAATGRPKVSWAAIKEISRYDVYRATSQKGTYTKIGSTTTTSYVDKTASVGKTYYYKVKAVCTADSSLNSKDSKVVSAITKCAAPKVKLSQSSKGYVTLKWSKVSGGKKYDVYVATSKNGTYKKLTTTTKTSYTYKKTSPGKEYFFKVRTVGSSGTTTGAYCEPLRMVRKLSTPKLTVTTKNGQATIKWKKISGATKYELQCSINGGSYKTITTTTKTSYTHKSLAGGNKYTYRLRAVSAVKDAASAYSSAKSVSIKCAAPTISVSLSGNKPVIKWSKVSGAAKYQVYYATSKSGKYKLVGTVTGTSYTHSGAPAAKACYYKVLAVDKNGTKGAYSSVKSITTKCAAPTAVKVKLNSKKQPVITWSKVSGAKKYEVYVATSQNGTYKKLTTTSKLTYTYTKAKAGTTYYFKITAHGASTASKSPYSAVVKTP